MQSARYQHEVNSSHPVVCHLKTYVRDWELLKHKEVPGTTRFSEAQRLPFSSEHSTHQLTKTAIAEIEANNLLRTNSLLYMGLRACKLWDPWGVLSL